MADGVPPPMLVSVSVTLVCPAVPVAAVANDLDETEEGVVVDVEVDVAGVVEVVEVVEVVVITTWTCMVKESVVL